MLSNLFLAPATTKMKVLRFALVALLVGVLASAFPAYRALRLWRAQRMAAAAEQTLQVNPGVALQKAQAAVELAPQDHRCLRTMARLLTRVGQEEAFRYWDLAAKRQSLSPQDAQERIELALKLRRLDLAEKYLTTELKRPPVRAPLLRCAAIFFALKGDLPSAIQMGRAWVTADPANIEAKFFVARHLLAAEDSSALPEAKQLLWQVIQGRHPEWPQALKSLAYLPNLTVPEIKECLRLFNGLPANDPKRDFVMIDLNLRVQPERTNELINAAVAYYRTGNAEVLLGLSRWLSQKGEHARVVELISAPVARSNRNLFLIYADALAALGHWTTLETILGEPTLPLEPLLVALYQARVAGELKKDRQKSSHWAQVHWLGSKNPDLLWYAAQYAAKVGEREEALKACRRLIEEEKFARGAWLTMIQLAQQKGDSQELRRLMAEMARRYPNDPVPANDLAYLDLLNGQNVAEAVATAQRLVKQHPNLLAYRTTLALAYLRTNNRAAARAVYQDVTVRWPEVAPAWQAIYAAVLGNSGDAEAARTVVRRLSQQQLRPEERALVQPWL